MKHKKMQQTGSLLTLIIAFSTIAVALSFGQSTVWNAQAQETATPTPTPDEEKEKLQRAADLATLKQTKAEADRKTAEAKFPKPATSPLDGKTTVEGAVIESQMVSYVSLSRSADRLMDAIKSNFTAADPRNLAIYNERDINLMLSYKVATGQIDIIKNGYAKFLTPTTTVSPCPTPTPTSSPTVHGGQPAMIPATLPLSAAESFLGSFVDLTALLRTNVEIKGQTFVIDEGPLVAEVFRAARNLKAPNGVRYLYYPYVFPPNVNADQKSDILGRLEAIHGLRVTAEQLLGTLTKTSKDLSDANDSIKQLTANINKGIPKKTAEAVAASGNIIKANCRKLSSDVDDIKSLPPELQGEAMVRLIEKARSTCRRMDPDKLEQLLGLSDTIEQLRKDLAEAKKNLAKVSAEETDLECKLRNLELKLALGTIVDPTDPDEIKEHAEVAAARLKAINAQFDGLVAALTQADGSGTNTLTNYIRVENLRMALPVDSSYWLQLKVINAGGNNRIKTNLLVDIFTGGNRISHSGGVIVEYHLFDSNGLSLASGTVSDYRNYVKASKIPDLTGSRR
jgi:hypothetical protein